MKPIAIRKVGRAWEVWLNLPAAYRYAPRRVHRKLEQKYGDTETLVVSPTGGGGLSLSATDRPHRFTKKDDARHAAHQIGRYLLDLGDFVHTYVEGY